MATSGLLTFGILMKLKKKDYAAGKVTPILQVLDVSRIKSSVYLLVVSDGEMTSFAKLIVDPETYKIKVDRYSIIELVEYESCWAKYDTKYTLLIHELIIKKRGKYIKGKIDSTTVDVYCSSPSEQSNMSWESMSDDSNESNDSKVSFELIYTITI
ncbi:hypothetical protein HCN44_006182 [Aphidius gifuensis]|uniref:Uncharacterized protein n=1 Tax=Aphidius gifuensis TaxID=684658 RepID=A0A834Y3X5_APHGI|nr:uncharacterized protein LOC122852972 [Aphidius gifuensis]KAF7997611.1 hypothetical protein HCN44_006182 [Aphidius gifuensis]